MSQFEAKFSQTTPRVLRIEFIFQTDVDAPKGLRDKVSKSLKKAVSDGTISPDQVQLWVLVQFPDENDHVGHFTNEVNVCMFKIN